MDQFRILGLDELRAGFANAPTTLMEANTQAITRSVFIVEAAAKSRTPFVTSRLKGSITHEVRDGIGRVGTNVVYARMIEFGAPAGFPINYARGRALKNGNRTKPYVAHLRHKREGRLYMTRGLVASMPEITAAFKTAYVQFLGHLKGG